MSIKNNPEQAVVIDERLRHIAFIMDGNGRWAKKRGLPRNLGHREGVKVFDTLINYCASIGIGAVTVYAFSTENWKRPEQEIEGLMNLVNIYLDRFTKESEKYQTELHFIGDMSAFPASMQEKIKRVEQLSLGKPCKLNIALNYGGRDEIVHACNALLSQGKSEVTAQDIARHLYTAHCPDPDLIVRTGGEMRLSNFLLWQAAYAEFYATDKLWPDMTTADVDDAIRAFYNRSRRFGGI